MPASHLLRPPHPVPSGTLVSDLQRPVAGLHAPASLHGLDAVQDTAAHKSGGGGGGGGGDFPGCGAGGGGGTGATHVPASHLLRPSHPLSCVPSGTLISELQRPVAGLHAPASLHGLDAVQDTATHKSVGGGGGGGGGGGTVEAGCGVGGGEPVEASGGKSPLVGTGGGGDEPCDGVVVGGDGCGGWLGLQSASSNNASTGLRCSVLSHVFKNSCKALTQEVAPHRPVLKVWS